MLVVYLYPAPKPANCFDLSYELLTTFTDTALGILAHHKTATLWFGYLEGWMLSPEEETRLRAVIRAFECHVITREPMSFSQAWKNEISVVHFKDVNGSTNAHDDGGVVHSERPPQHEPPSGVPPIDGVHHQG
jgi:hypothetical protein